MITLTVNSSIFTPSLSILKTLNLWERNANTRKQLKKLTPLQLEDIGLTKNRQPKKADNYFGTKLTTKDFYVQRITHFICLG